MGCRLQEASHRKVNTPTCTGIHHTEETAGNRPAGGVFHSESHLFCSVKLQVSCAVFTVSTPAERLVSFRVLIEGRFCFWRGLSPSLYQSRANKCDLHPPGRSYIRRFHTSRNSIAHRTHKHMSLCETAHILTSTGFLRYNHTEKHRRVYFINTKIISPKKK